MPSDLPLSRRPAPQTRPGRSDSPLLAILLGVVFGGVVMLILGISYLIWRRYEPPRPPAQPALASAPTTPTPIPTETSAAPSSVGAGFAPRAPVEEKPAPTSIVSPTAKKNSTIAAPGEPAAEKPALTQTKTPASTKNASPAKPSPTPLTYTVQPGDSLYQIASRFGVDVLDLMIANHIANPSIIQPGDVYTIPGPGTVARGPIASGPKSILVDIPSQHLYAYQGNTLVYSFVVSTGAYDGTLRGDFQILDKLPRPYSDAWNFWMPDWLGFYYAGGLENGFHALPVLPDGSQIWGDTLGTPTTYGCVVLGTLEAQLLYDWADVGTPVKVK